MKKLSLLFVLFGFALQIFGQKTIINGCVTDAETGFPMPFVNISFKGTKIGTTTNLNGKYSLESYYASDSLQASFVGFNKLSKKVKKESTQEINFQLQSNNVQLHEIEISTSKKDKSNPALEIMKRVVDNKPINNREKLDAYQYEVYNKIEFDLNNIPDELRNKKLMKPFEFVFDNMDTSASKTYIPMFMTETVSDYYFKKDPQVSTEIIKATKVSGLENESISQFLGDMYQNVNIYDNYIVAFNKSFVSPVANFGTLSYNYYLVDSGVRDGVWSYKIQFFPKRQGEMTFKGDLWIADTTFAVKEAEVTISEKSNINFITEFSVTQKFEQVEKEVWMLVEDKLMVDFEVAKKAMGLYGKKSSSYRNFEINKPKPKEFYNSSDNVVVEKNANSKTEEEWENLRHKELSNKELTIYNMVDSLKEIPQFNTYLDLITLFVSGYYVVGDVEIGPYFTFYSYNPIEGNRIKFGMRSSNEFSTVFMPEFYVAFGTLDKELKYGAGFQYFLSKEPRQKVGAYFKNDIEQLGMSQNAWRNDNILTSLFRRNPALQLNGYREYDLYYEREWFQGLINRVNFTHKYLWSVSPNLNFYERTNDGSYQRAHNIPFSEISLLTRFAYKEKYVNGEFERVSLGTKYPIIQAKLTLGLPNVFESKYQYQKVVLNLQDKIRLGYFGYSEIDLTAGKIFGNAPFPILELHNGNETLFYDPYAYNLMNFYEFVSDEWASINFTHHFNGLLLNKAPLLNKLKFREVATFKTVAGRLSNKNESLMQFPAGLNTLNKPYAEGGIGVENIFKFFRVDAIWRLTYLNNPNIAKFGIRTAFQIDF